MLPIAIAALIAGTIYAVTIAPPDQRVLVALVFVALAGAGIGVGFGITKPGSDERTYYPMATGMGGLMFAFAWVSNRRKKWPKKGEDKAAPKS